MLLAIYDGDAVMRSYDERGVMPGTGEDPESILRRATTLAGSDGDRYVTRRGVSVEVAAASGLRFAVDFAGRPAVLATMRDRNERVTAVHGRYLHARSCENKMLTIGYPNGVFGVLGSWHLDPLILVEGVFDALSLAECGIACSATVGRFAPWLGDVAAGRVVWAGFDRGKPGDAEAERYAVRLAASQVRRLRPPGRCKDWNTALVRLGRGTIERWIRECLNGENGRDA